MSKPFEDTDGRSRAASRAGAAAVVVPPLGPRARVRLGSPPGHPPDDLVAFVVARGDDWVLTDDVVAFGEATVLQRYRSWRSGWELERVLDPLTTLRRLLDLADVLPGGRASTTRLRRIADEVGIAAEAVVDVVDADVVHEQLQWLAEVVRGRDALGHGLVDLTPGAERIGLALAWPSCGGSELLSAANGIEVWFVPDEGLFLQVPGRERFGPIETVASDATGWSARTVERDLRIDHGGGRPIAWLVPDATAWRHVRVPEAVTWAATLAGLEDCLEAARRVDAPVRIGW